MKPKALKGKGEVDYDYKQDILFFKIAEREYQKSLEFDNIVVDADKEGFIVGMQIFEASKFFNIPKAMLIKIPHWQFQTQVHENIIEIRLTFKTARNKVLSMNKIPISTDSNFQPLQDAEVLAQTA